MKRLGPNKRIRLALDVVNREISDLSRRDGSIFSGGLASEGYAGGYRDALNDVILVLNRVKPSTRHYWDNQ